MQTGPKFKKNETEITKQRKRTLAPYLFKWEDEVKKVEKEKKRIDGKSKRRKKNQQVKTELDVCLCPNIVKDVNNIQSLDFCIIPPAQSSDNLQKVSESLTSIESIETRDQVDSKTPPINIDLSEELFQMVNNSNIISHGELFEIKEHLKAENEELKTQVEFWRNKYLDIIKNSLDCDDFFIKSEMTEITEITKTEVTKTVISPITSPLKPLSPQFKSFTSSPTSSPVKKTVQRSLFSDFLYDSTPPNFSPPFLRKPL